MIRFCTIPMSLSLLLAACQPSGETPKPEVSATAKPEQTTATEAMTAHPSRFDVYTTVRLTADLSQLTDGQKKLLPLLIEAAKIMDELFWQQAYGDPKKLLGSMANEHERRFAEINYGPWDRLAANQPFVEGAGPKPPGARFYPEDMSKQEFEAWDQEGKNGLYSLVQRDERGQLTLVPYREAYQTALANTAGLLRQAAKLTEDPEFANFLRLRADALETDNYQPSDLAWMDMKRNPIELIIGPIETYEDQLFGYRAAFEAIVLIKDQVWSERLARFAKFLPELQSGLPVPEVYKRERPGSNADLNAYDVIYYAGHANAGAKSIAINLPNDEQVQLAKGTRRLQLKNTTLAKFNKILLPIADVLIADDQRRHVTFDSFFGNTMFHEVAHGLGIKNTLGGKNTVRRALKDHATALEEGKADILGLYMVQKLREEGEITEGELMDDYVTFMAGILRSVRFGASDAHGVANMICFNFFQQAGAFTRDEENGKYRVKVAQFEQAIEDLSRRLLTLQGDGNYGEVDAFVKQYVNIGSQLQTDLGRLAAASIPVDVVFEQGPEILGL